VAGDTVSSSAIQALPIWHAPVVFTAEDFDRFVLSQREAVAAASDALAAKRHREEIGEQVGAWISRIREWCKDHPVEACVAAPRMDDIMVVVIASDEDPGGRLHDAMSAVDLESFERNGLRLSWLLLRASEAAGLSAFVSTDAARTLYRRAKEQAA